MNMNNLIPEEWLPMEPQKGPPLPKSLQIYWPWYKPPEVPPEAPIYACPYCTAEFATEAELFAHIIKDHAGQPPKIIYMCPHCGARFDTMTALQEHMAIVHAPPVVYTCPHCGAQFATEAELSYHIQLVHPTVPPVVFTCTICGATFATQAELDYHMATIHPEAPPAPPGVADIRVENLTIEPVEVYVGDQVTISVVAKNYGTASGSKVITCNVNGQVSSQSVELSPNQSRWVTFTATPQEARTYQVLVNGLTGTFKAIAIVVRAFTFSTPIVNVSTDKLAVAWRVAEMSVRLTNPHNTEVTRLIYGCWAFESRPSDWNCNRRWNGGIEYELTLSPGSSRTLFSPAYYYDEYGEEHSNSPAMGFSAGVPKKYYFSFSDDLGNRSPGVKA